MSEESKQHQLLKKDPKGICLGLGKNYVLFGIFGLGMIYIQAQMTEAASMSDEVVPKLLNTLHDIWMLFLPFLVLLGLCYHLFGYQFDKIKKHRQLINILLALLTLSWTIAYVISSLKFFEIFLALLSKEMGSVDYLFYPITIIMGLMMIAIMTVPQYVLGKKISKLQS